MCPTRGCRPSWRRDRTASTASCATLSFSSWRWTGRPAIAKDAGRLSTAAGNRANPSHRARNGSPASLLNVRSRPAMRPISVELPCMQSAACQHPLRCADASSATTKTALPLDRDRCSPFRLRTRRRRSTSNSARRRPWRASIDRSRLARRDASETAWRPRSSLPDRRAGHRHVGVAVRPSTPTGAARLAPLRQGRHSRSISRTTFPMHSRAAGEKLLYKGSGFSQTDSSGVKRS